MMLKGIQKNMILVKLPRSSYFESAYFVLRSLGKEARPAEMVKEANKIIAESGLFAQKKGPSLRRERIAFFIYGALCGAFSVAVLWLIFLIWA